MDKYLDPSFIYSWSVSHIWEHKFCYLSRLGRLGSNEEKSIEFFLASSMGVFFNFLWAKKRYFCKYLF